MIALTLALLVIAVTTQASSGQSQCCNEPLYNYTATHVEPGLQWYFVVAFGDNRPEDIKQTTPPKTFYQIINETSKLHPYAIIGTGDHVGEGRDSQYKELWKALSNLENVLLVPGNHDLLISGSSDRWERYVGPRYWCWQGIPGWGIVGVDTYDRLIPRFRQETSKVFQECSAGKIILVTHYPIEPNIGYNIDKAPSGTTKKRILEELIGKYNVSIVIQGHWHGYAEKRIGDTLYIITGGAGAPFYSIEAGKTDADYYRTFLPHYIILVLRPEGEYKVLPIYLNKGRIVIEKPEPWKAHIYQDKFLLNGTPADIPIRVSLTRGNTSADIQMIIPHSTWINVTLLENGSLNVQGKAKNVQLLRTTYNNNNYNSKNFSLNQPKVNNKYTIHKENHYGILKIETILSIGIIIFLTIFKISVKNRL